MSDLALKRLSDGCFDLDFDGLDLLLTNTLENAVIISIGSYAREVTGETANTEPDIGGWWGDAVEDNLIKLGGYLHKAFHKKLTNATCRDIEGFVNDALKWMVNDGIAKETSCSASISGSKMISMTVIITKPSGSPETFTYEFNWEATLA